MHKRHGVRPLRAVEDRLDAAARIESPPVIDRRIGAILVDMGKLMMDQAEQVLSVQRDHGGSFGSIAIDLGYVEAVDVRRALSRQRVHAELLPSDRQRLTPSLRAAFDDESYLQAWRQARTQLEMRWLDDSIEGKMLTAVSSRAAEGRSTACASLGILIAQTGRRVLLLDTCPPGPATLTSLLGGPRDGLPLADALDSPSSATRLPSLFDAIDVCLVCRPASPLNVDLLAGPAFADLLESAANQFDVVLVDAPAINEEPVALAIAMRTSNALVVARVGRTRTHDLMSLRGRLSDAGVAIVGVVANRF